MEGYSDKALESILSPDEMRILFEFIGSDAFIILDKVNFQVQKDWVEQTAMLDVSQLDDQKMLSMLRQRNGMIKGVSMFLAYLQRKKSKVKKEVSRNKLRDNGNS